MAVEEICPLCQQSRLLPQPGLVWRCAHCQLDFRQSGGFWLNSRQRLLFLLGALLLGSLAAPLHHLLGLEEWLLARLFLDLTLALLYFLGAGLLLGHQHWLTAQPQRTP